MQLALAGGRSPRQIVSEFKTSELSELLAEKRLQEKERDKEDVRHALLMSAVVSVGGNKVSPKKFLIDWNPGEIDKEEYLERSKGYWMSVTAAGAIKKTKKAGEN